MFKTLFSYFKPFLGLFFVACCLTVGQVVAELQLPAIMADIVDVGIRSMDMGYVIERGLWMLGWAIGSVVCVVIASLAAARGAMGFGRDVRSALFAAVQRYSLVEFNRLGTSTLITRNTNDVQQLERFCQMLMTMAVMTPVMLVGSCVMAFQTDARMASIVMWAIPILVVVVLVFLKFGMPLLRSLQTRIDAVNRVMREGLTGVRVVRAYNREEHERQRFATVNRDLSETYVKVGRLVGGIMPFMLLILNGTIVALYWFGAEAVDAGSLSAGEIMALVQYVTMILMSTMMLSMVFAILPRTLAAAERVCEVLDTKPSIMDEGSIEALPENPEGPVVELCDVAHRFEGAERPSVHGLNFSLPRRGITVLIGPTGSGKSVIVNLMLRLYEPCEGSVRFDGIDERELSMAALRSRIAYVPQKAVLFTGTIAQNLRMGNEHATDEELWRALEIAQAADFVRSHEEGLEYALAQGGENLSGGQRQRLTIARALVRPAELYLFDDSFSALDYKTDALVRRAIKEHLSDASVLVVSQRVGVALDADQVVVLAEDGSVEDRGTHEELYRRCAAYRELALSQLSAEELEGGDA